MIENRTDFVQVNEYLPPRKITLGDLADNIKELLADRGVEAVIVVLPGGSLEVKRAKKETE